MIRLVAHRGLSAVCPENTAAAFQAAARAGYSYIELDPRFTADGQCVILHDALLNRTARDRETLLPPGEPLPIAQQDSAQLSRYEFGSWFSAEFAGEPIPLLRQVLGLAREYRIRLKFDNILETVASPAQRERFYQEVENAGAAEWVGLTAKSVAGAAAFAARFPTAELHYDGPVNASTLAELAKATPSCDRIIWLPLRKMSWLPYPPADPETARLAKQYGRLGLWDAFSAEELQACLALGADLVESDGRVPAEPPAQ